MSRAQSQPGPRSTQVLPGPRLDRPSVTRESANPLGSFLRARRDLVSPSQAGIRFPGRRRVPGLRREEVALLAGISPDYYLRLERGRDRNPSVQVLDAIARVLQLNNEHREHLYHLASYSPRGSRVVERDAQSEGQPEGSFALLRTLRLPSFIEDPSFTIVASNVAARALSPRLAAGRNRLRDLLSDPAEHALYPQWEGMTECLVANLRQSAALELDNPRFAEFVAELSRDNVRFAQLWSRHEVRGQRGTEIRIDHPVLGDMVLNRERLAISGTPGLQLVIYHTASSAAAEKLTRLAGPET